MRCVTYAGKTVTTTDDVAQALVQLTAGLAAAGVAEAVSIPIVSETGVRELAELVIGVGNDVLSAPSPFDDASPDFSREASQLMRNVHYPVTTATTFEPVGVRDLDPRIEAYDPDLEGQLDA